MSTRIISAFLIVLPVLASAGAKPRFKCADHVTRPVSVEGLMAELENKALELGRIAKAQPMDTDQFVTVFSEIQTTARIWNTFGDNPQTEVFMTWMRAYSLEMEKTTANFLQAQRSPLPKIQAEKLLSSSGGFVPTAIVRMGILRLAVAHSSLTGLGLDHHQKAVLLNEALSVATQLAPHLGYSEGFWGDVYLDLNNWKYLATPQPVGLIAKVNQVLSLSLAHVEADRLTLPQLRFFADTVALLPSHLGARSSVDAQMRATLMLILKHKEQLQRRVPKAFQTLSPFLGPSAGIKPVGAI